MREKAKKVNSTKNCITNEETSRSIFHECDISTNKWSFIRMYKTPHSSIVNINADYTKSISSNYRM
jgi:acetone carboxylase gamma subunit